jgi:hypothetical protein
MLPPLFDLLVVSFLVLKPLRQVFVLGFTDRLVDCPAVVPPPVPVIFGDSCSWWTTDKHSLEQLRPIGLRAPDGGPHRNSTRQPPAAITEGRMRLEGLFTGPPGNPARRV